MNAPDERLASLLQSEAGARCPCWRERAGPRLANRRRLGARQLLATKLTIGLARSAQASRSLLVINDGLMAALPAGRGSRSAVEVVEGELSRPPRSRCDRRIPPAGAARFPLRFCSNDAKRFIRRIHSKTPGSCDPGACIDFV